MNILLALIRRVPSWVWLLLAVGSFLLLRWIASRELAPGLSSTMILGAVTQGLAKAAEIVLPAGLVLCAGLSVFLRLALREGEPVPASDPLWGKPPVDKSQWSLDLLRALEWKRFEIVCAAYFEEIGFRAEGSSPGPDGGVDIYLYADGATSAAIVVQCKAWKSGKVGVKPVRELLGVMSAAAIGEGIFATTTTFTSEARQFVQGKNIHLIDGLGFVDMLTKLPVERQRALLSVATEGDFSTPTCPSCGVKMLPRMPRAGGSAFWGCPSFPRCRTTIPMAKD